MRILGTGWVHATPARVQALHLKDSQHIDARGEGEVLRVMQSALQVLPALTSEGYCQRVRQRLMEALPVEHCSAFAAIA